MNLADQPWTRMRDALASGRPVVAILPLGATEAHGPHLPLGTDNIISEGIGHRAARRLEREGCCAFVLPTLAYAPTDYAAGFAGTIGISAVAAGAVIADIAASLGKQGVACLALANSHFDPANVAMLRGCVAALDGGIALAFPDFTRRALATRLTDEFRSGACHAGQFETSLVMADRPDLVDAVVASGLAENPSSLTEAFAAGARNFAEAGGPDAYFGAPAAASAGEGEESYAIMAEALVASVISLIKDKPA